MNLNVPFYSQKDEEVVEKYGYGACGLISLRMILEFYGVHLNFEQLDRLAREEGAFNHEKGWVHASLVNIARKAGLRGFRINYKTLSQKDLNNAQRVLSQEGASPREIELFTANFHIAKKKGAIDALGHLLESKTPVIVSMQRTYADTPTTHMLAVRGKENESLILNDPWHFGPNHPISCQKFNSLWTQRAVVILKCKKG